MNTSNVSELHDLAMEFSDKAFIAKRQGKTELAREFLREAYRLEVTAAELVRNDFSEPTRSVLYRSAASLAVECEELREAERLISIALSGNPPFEIAEELRDLLEQVNFDRHLRLKNVNLDSSELQLSIAGSSVGHGIALSDALIERVKDIERLMFRTIERILGQEFREHGKAKRNVQEYSLYIAAPRAGSLAVTLRLGKQMELPGFDLSGRVIDEVIECFRLLNDDKEEELKERIPQESYLHNFIGLAKRIAPDGDKVNVVGFTSLKGNKETKMAFTRTQKDLSRDRYASLALKEETASAIEVKGRLLFADARRRAGKIRLVDDDNRYHSIVVPEGMMDDIVKPLWDEIVVVRGLKMKSHIRLKEISKSA